MSSLDAVPAALAVALLLPPLLWPRHLMWLWRGGKPGRAEFNRNRRVLALAIASGQTEVLAGLPVLLAPQIVPDDRAGWRSVVYVGTVVSTLIAGVALAPLADLVGPAALPAGLLAGAALAVTSMMEQVAVTAFAMAALGLCSVVPVAAWATAVGSGSRTDASRFMAWGSAWSGASGIATLALAQAWGWRSALLTGAICSALLALLLVVLLDAGDRSRELRLATWTRAVRVAVPRWRDPLVQLSAANLAWVCVWMLALPALANSHGAGPGALGWLRAIVRWVPPLAAAAWLARAASRPLWLTWLLAAAALTGIGISSVAFQQPGDVLPWLVCTTLAYTVALTFGEAISTTVGRLAATRGEHKASATGALSIVDTAAYPLGLVGWAAFSMAGVGALTGLSVAAAVAGLMVAWRWRAELQKA